MLTQIKFYMILHIVILLATFTPSYCYTITASSIRDLTDDNTDFELETLSWIPFNNKTATLYDRCGSLYYMGGHNVSYLQSSFTRNYSGLPSHNNIYFTLYFVIIDDWATTDTAVIEFDSYPVTFLYNYSQASYSTSMICGGPQKDRTGTRIRGKIPHTGSTLNVTISSNSSTGAVAFRNLTLSFRNQLPEETQPTCVISLFGYRRVATCGNCPEGQYRSTNGNCYNCHANCLTCYGTGPTDCGIYQPGIIPLGIRCAPYYSPCSNCTINEKEYFSYRDHSWLGTCSPPLMGDPYGTIRSCTQDCQSNECLNPNGTCGTQCESPLFPIVRYNMTFCEYRCSFGNIMYTNLSCINSCGYPLVVRATPNGKICEYPCASNEIISYYNVCIPACPYPFHNTTNIYDRYCEYACNVTAGEVRFYNNTCDQLTKCTAPLVLKDTAPPYKTCESSCLMSEFIYWNTSCKSTCPDPFTTRLQFGLKFCDPPMCGSTPCQSCRSTSECPENYNCNTFIGGYCMIKTAYFKAGLAMTITNGYVIVAEVTPKVDLQEAVDDILNVLSVSGLVLMQDYQVLIEKISLAKFKVTILLLRSVSSDSLVASLQYSPFRLDYRTEVLLPRMVYISEETVKTSQKVGTATDTSFILLIVSIVAFVVLGKISNVFSFICINQYLHGLLYLNANYLQHVKFYLKSLKNYNAIFSSDEIGETNIDSVITRRMSLPVRFFEEEFPLSFIWNSVQIFGTVLGTLSILGIVFFFLKTLRTPPKLLRKLRSILKWNLLIRQILTYSVSLVTAAFIQIHASIFGRQKNILPLLGAFLCLVCFMAIFAKMFGVIAYIPQTIQSRVAYTGRYGSLWQGLNLNGSYRYYYWLSFLRGLLLVYVCVFMELYPIAQLLILMTYQVGMISLFVRGISMRPVMLDKSLNFVSLLLEILLLVTKGAILCSWAMSERLVSDQILLLTGWAIVGFGVLIQMSQAIYSMYMQVVNWKKIWAEIKELWRSILRKPKRKKIKRLKVERIFEDGVQ